MLRGEPGEMTIEKQPFRLYNLDGEKPDIFTIRLNGQERKELNEIKVLVDQPKDSTALKLMAYIGYLILHSPLERDILAAVFINKKNNERSGAFVDSARIDTNVTQKAPEM